MLEGLLEGGAGGEGSRNEKAEQAAVARSVVNAEHQAAAVDASVVVKVEPHPGTYDCLFCEESVRKSDAVYQCSQCVGQQPFHAACAGPKWSKFARNVSNKLLCLG